MDILRACLVATLFILEEIMEKEIYYRQGDVLYFDFSPSVDTEINGIRPAVVVSNDQYNRHTGYLMVVPITAHGTNFGSYVDLDGYKHFYGRANAAQVHCYSAARARSKAMEQLRVQDFNQIKRKVKEILAY